MYLQTFALQQKEAPAFVLISAEIQGQMLLDPLKTIVAVAVVICKVKCKEIMVKMKSTSF